MKKAVSWRVLVVAFLAAAIIITLFAIQSLVQASYDDTNLSVSQAFLLHTTPWLCWFLLAPFVFAFAGVQVRRQATLAARVLLQLAAAITFVAVHVIATALITYAVGLTVHDFTVPQLIQRAFVIHTASDLLTYVAIAAISHTAHYFQALRAKDAELRASQMHRVESITTLAGALAHDFNNLLTGVRGFAELALERATDDQLKRDLLQIQNAAMRATDLTRQLLAVSRGQVLQLETIDLQQLLSATVAELQARLPAGVEFTYWIQQDPLLVRGDRDKLAQALAAGLANVRERLHGGDRLELRAFADRKRMVITIEVRDTGPAIQPEQFNDQLDPANLVRGGGMVSGLGLVSMATIVRRSGGAVTTEPLGHRGNIVRITLPQVVLDSGDKPVPAMPVADARRKRTILVAEDEPSLRLLARRTLERSGFRVIIASDGAEALELAAQHPDPIDLLVTDVVMPRVGGVELARELERARPGIAVLYMSGYAADEVLRDQIADQHRPFLEKPFTPLQLVQKVGAVLS